jgi:peptidoglycan/xylan/chitin deacetylase (PgdA/CDA1 family)
MYHELTNGEPENAYTFSRSEFESNLQFLHDGGFETVLTEDLIRSVEEPDFRLPGRPVMITFDDGHESDFTTALPLLLKFNFRATFFVTTGWIGQKKYLQPEQIVALKNAGMSVQSHGSTHTFLNGLSNSEIRREIDDSRNRLSEILGDRVTLLSFPGGRYNRRVIECARKSGLKALLSSAPFTFRREGAVYLIGRNVMRIASRGGNGVSQIVNAGFWGRQKLKAAYFGKSMLKEMLPGNLYGSLWKRYTNRSS